MGIIVKRVQKILRAETRRIRALPPVFGTGQHLISPLPEGGCEGRPLIKTHPLRDAISMPYLQKKHPLSDEL